jgi:hypothetical protein
VGSAKMTVTGPSLGDNSTFSGNTTTVNPNATIWVLPPNPGRSLQADIIACAVITFLIASTFVVLRFYTRGRVNHVLGASDWCILPALVREIEDIPVAGSVLIYSAALRGWCHR